MKILFQNRSPSSWIGGDSIKLQSLMDSLKLLDVDVEFSHNIHEPKAKNADIVHVFNLSMDWTKHQIKNAIMYNKPLVISSIFHPSEGCYSFQEQKGFVEYAGAIIVMSQAEQDLMAKTLKLNDETLKKFHIIPNGIDKPFFDVAGEKGRHYVMAAGRFEHLKNFKAVAKACKALGYPLLIVGSASNEQYIEETKKENPQMVYIEDVPRHQMPKLYSHAKVFCVLSDSEAYSYTILEAGASGCNVLYTMKALGGKDLPYIYLTDIENDQHIIDKMQEAWQRGNDNQFSDYLQQEFTWDNRSRQVKEIYESIKK